MVFQNLRGLQRLEVKIDNAGPKKWWIRKKANCVSKSKEGYCRNYLGLDR